MSLGITRSGGGLFFVGGEEWREEEEGRESTQKNPLFKVKSLYGHNNVETSSKGQANIGWS